MESLSPECTPHKHRYDSCFNSWFEGYLQPALDGYKSSFAFSTSRFSDPSSFSTTSISSDPPSSLPSDLAPRSRLITSWASALGTRRGSAGSLPTATEVGPDATASIDPSHSHERARPIDTAGKTRAQIKAEEYEKACGESWRVYQLCLKKAIAANTSLSTLLEQAREEHPLHSQEGLGGSPWDPNSGIRIKE